MKRQLNKIASVFVLWSHTGMWSTIVKGIYFILNIYTGHRQNVIDHLLSPFTCKIEHEIVQNLSLNSIKIASNIQSKNIYQVVQKYRLLLYKQLG